MLAHALNKYAVKFAVKVLLAHALNSGVLRYIVFEEYVPIRISMAQQIEKNVFFRLSVGGCVFVWILLISEGKRSSVIFRIRGEKI